MSREIPYAPMEKPKRVSFKRMQEILEKHTQRVQGLKHLDQEMWLVKKLNGHGSSVFEGDTTERDRKGRIREILQSNNLMSEVCGKRAGVPTTFGELFQLIYGESV